MRYSIELLNVPNQTLSTTAGGTDIFITLDTFNGVTYASVRTQDEQICTSVRCVSNISIIPEWFAERIGGILYFEGDEEYPHYETFNQHGHKLIFETDS